MAAGLYPHYFAVTYGRPHDSKGVAIIKGPFPVGELELIYRVFVAPLALIKHR